MGSWRTRLSVLLLFLVLTVLFTYPLVLHLRTAVPGPPWDNLVWLYDLWWFRHSIVDLGQWPTFNTTIFHPYGYDLRLSELMLPNKLLIAPLLFLGDEVLAYNGLLLLSFVLTGYATYLFIAYLTADRLAGVVAGAIFAFCSYRMHAMAAGWLPLISTQWIPLTFSLRGAHVPRGKGRLCAGGWPLYGTRTSSLRGTIFMSWGPLWLRYVLIRLWPWRTSLGRALVWRNLALMVATVGASGVARRPAGAASRDRGAWVGPWPTWKSGLLAWRIFSCPTSTTHCGDASFSAPARLYASLSVVRARLCLSWAGYPCCWPPVGLFWNKRPRQVATPMVWLGGLSFVMALGVVLHWNNGVVEVPVPRRARNMGGSRHVHADEQVGAAQGLLL